MFCVEKNLNKLFKKFFPGQKNEMHYQKIEMAGKKMETCHGSKPWHV